MLQGRTALTIFRNALINYIGSRVTIVINCLLLIACVSKLNQFILITFTYYLYQLLQLTIFITTSITTSITISITISITTSITTFINYLHPIAWLADPIFSLGFNRQARFSGSKFFNFPKKDQIGFIEPKLNLSSLLFLFKQHIFPNQVQITFKEGKTKHNDTGIFTRSPATFNEST